MKRNWWIIGLAVAFVLALLSPLASPWPDGLERVAEDAGFIERAKEAAFNIIPDYVFPGVSNEALATILAGLIGTALLFAIGYGLGKLLAQKA